ncbi:hypothetical protein [Chelatococcus reniformis]|uniref:Uncharacterized protein n=1 Tax=Chelatococcus reniformis TaxID=1494448 RepID=A0A916UEB6_9HYPH|nr:hypothetical protein [Chelatococcus reniformis]GGC70479.1 hypothetical protein GCM10010994_31260 [Chelatococcus reniformis]
MAASSPVTIISITDAAAWSAFWASNQEALTDEVGSEAECIDLARRGELVIGGGAAPLFVVSIETDDG